MRHKWHVPIGFLSLRKPSQKSLSGFGACYRSQAESVLCPHPGQRPPKHLSSKASGSDLRNVKQASSEIFCAEIFETICVEILSLSVRIRKIVSKYKSVYFLINLKISLKSQVFNISQRCQNYVQERSRKLNCKVCYVDWDLLRRVPF